MSASLRIALAGNPNVGKTSLFNVLTGARLQVGNYAGVTVEIRQGDLRPDLAAGRRIAVVDLPGTYSLTPIAEDEAAALRGLQGEATEAAGGKRRPPDVVILVVDAANLARNLYLAIQVIELGRPLVVALNMIDVAKAAGLDIDAAALSRELGVPVIPTVARRGEGAEALIKAAVSIADGEWAPSATLAALRGRLLVPVPEAEPGPSARALALLGEAVDPVAARGLLGARAAGSLDLLAASPADRAAAEAIDEALALEAAAELVIARYHEVDRLIDGLGLRERAAERAPAMSRSEKIDRVLTHRVFGLVFFLGVMSLLFTSIFSWAEPVMGVIEELIAWLSDQTTALLGAGVFTDLVVDGVIAGVGNVLVFVPQIALLFLFVGLLEDSGYMARAAFLIDRLMARVGLHGKAFVPLLSGYACAIPAILGTRTISSFRDRLVTILMIPYMSCSARLPIYVLLIAALFPSDERLGPFTLGGLILLAMYLLSTASAIAVGAIYKRTILRSPTPPLVLELPPYRLPRLRNTLLAVFDRTMDFVREAGTVILAMTVVLWALLSFPKPPEAPETPPGAPVEVVAADATPASDVPPAIVHSIGGRVGKALEPALEPMGQDWRIGIAILGSFAAREVMVSTLGLVYGIEGADDDDRPLRETLRAATNPDGSRRYTPLGGVALMVFYVYACLCMSTVAVVRRETRSWRWPIFMFVSMTVFAYVAAVLVYQVGGLLGFA
ncbi:MAG: ferrous iron transport protein B [Myxococcales bacterium]|nr:ferrous iron transport protein B [Myxococcales bacterium]